MRFSIALACTVTGLALAGAALAAPGLTLDKRDIGSKQCKPSGQKSTQLVDVHYRLLNDADSGFGGNYWASDTIDRHLRIWSLSGGTYCVQVADHGTFATYAGTSPSGSGTVSAGVRGELEGGYVTTSIVGTFAPTLPTRGDLGSYDLQCDSSAHCPGSAIGWTSYFGSISSANAFAQWGWIYHAGKHGTWLNQDDVAAVDSGDVTG